VLKGYKKPRRLKRENINVRVKTFSKKTITAGLGSALALIGLSLAPAMAASTFTDNLWNFAAGQVLNVIDLNKGASRVLDDSQLHIATDDYLFIDAPQSTILSGQLQTAGQAVIGGNLTVNGATVTFGNTSTVGAHLTSIQSAVPTCVSTMTATTPTCTVVGTDTKGTVTGAGTTAQAGSFVVTFSRAYATNAPVVVITAANLSAATAAALPFVSSSTTTFTITAAAATSTVTPAWNYMVIQ